VGTTASPSSLIGVIDTEKQQPKWLRNISIVFLVSVPEDEMTERHLRPQGFDCNRIVIVFF